MALFSNHKKINLSRDVHSICSYKELFDGISSEVSNSATLPGKGTTSSPRVKKTFDLSFIY